METTSPPGSRESPEQSHSPLAANSDPEKEEGPLFIRNPRFLLEALQDIHKNEEAVIFKNRHGDMSFVLQSTSESTDQMMTFDVSYMYDEDEDCHGKIKHVLDMEYNAIRSDDSLWTLYMFTIGVDPPISDVEEMADALNTLYTIRFCECFEYFIKTPNRSLCHMCSMRRDTHENTQECVICNDPILTELGSMHMKSCCGQYMHKRCVEMWRRDNPCKTCPICRKNSQHATS